MIDKSKGRIEKYILRKAFDVEEDPYLPKEVGGATQCSRL
jgi:asparagine synthase (glutamine-hydrolysing)